MLRANAKQWPDCLINGLRTGCRYMLENQTFSLHIKISPKGILDLEDRINTVKTFEKF